jgi:hypothetical protein
MGMTMRYVRISAVAANGSAEIAPNTRAAGPDVRATISGTTPLSPTSITAANCTLSQTITSSALDITLTTSANAGVVAGDIVYHDVAVEGVVAGNEYTVVSVSVGAGTVRLTWPSGSRTLTSTKTLTVGTHGDLVAGDTVYHDIAAVAPVGGAGTGTNYTVDSATGGLMQLSWTGGGSRTLTVGKILSPGNHNRGVIGLHGFQVSSATANATFRFASGITPLSGAESMAAGTPASMTPTKHPILCSRPNEALYVLPATGILNGFAVISQEY